MQIDGISSIPPIGSISPILQPEGPVARTPGAAQTTSQPTPSNPAVTPAANKSESSRSRTASNPRGGSSRGGSSGSGTASTSSSTTASAASLIAAVYTTTVDGKTYTGSVEESGGEYVASVPGLPSASGDTVAAAEIALGSIIDAIV